MYTVPCLLQDGIFQENSFSHDLALLRKHAVMASCIRYPYEIASIRDSRPKIAAYGITPCHILGPPAVTSDTHLSYVCHVTISEIAGNRKLMIVAHAHVLIIATEAEGSHEMRVVALPRNTNKEQRGAHWQNREWRKEMPKEWRREVRHQLSRQRRRRVRPNSSHVV